MEYVTSYCTAYEQNVRSKEKRGELDWSFKVIAKRRVRLEL